MVPSGADWLRARPRCAFYAPAVGQRVSQRVSEWVGQQLRVHLQESRAAAAAAAAPEAGTVPVLLLLLLRPLDVVRLLREESGVAPSTALLPSGSVGKHPLKSDHTH